MPQGLTPGQRTIRARLGALALHASHDSRETSLAGRTAFLERFEREVDPEGVLPLEERQRRAMYARKAHFTKMALERELKKSRKDRTAGLEPNPAADEESAGGASRVPDDEQRPAS